MQRPGGQGTAFSIDSLIGTPPPRSGHLLYTGYPMFMPYRPLVLPQALSHAPLQSGLPPLAPLASFAGRLTNTFCASLGQAVPSMVALTTALPSFSEPPDGFYPPQELPPPRAPPEGGCRRGPDGLEAEELPPGRDKGPPEPPLHFPDPFPGLAGKSGAGPSRRAERGRPAWPGAPEPRGDPPGSVRRLRGAGGSRGERGAPDLPSAAFRRTEPISLHTRPVGSFRGWTSNLARPGRAGGGRGGRAAGDGDGGAPAGLEPPLGALRGAGTRPGPAEAGGGGESPGSVLSPPRPPRSRSRSRYRPRLVRREVSLVPGVGARGVLRLPAF